MQERRETDRHKNRFKIAKISPLYVRIFNQTLTLQKRERKGEYSKHFSVSA